MGSNGHLSFQTSSMYWTMMRDSHTGFPLWMRTGIFLWRGSSLKAEDSCSSSRRPCTHTWYPSQPEQSSPSSQTYWARNLAEPRRPPLSQNRRYWSNIERAGKRKERWWSERWYAKNTLKIAWIFSHRRRLIRYFINKKINNAEVWLWLKSILVLPRLSCEIIFSQSQTSVSAWTGHFASFDFFSS